MLNKNILLIVTGSIACLDIPSYIVVLKTNGWQCKCIMTRAACQLVNPSSLAAFVDVFSDDIVKTGAVARVPHIDLANWASVVVVIPASANTIGKIAVGLADNLATTTILSTVSPVIIFPNMAKQMADQPVVQRNVATLTERKYHIWTEIQSGYSAGMDEYQNSYSLPHPTAFLEFVETIFERR